MSDIIGHMTCPVCGEPAQDVKLNKNGNMFVICDNNCRISFSGKINKKYKPQLLAGHVIVDEKLGAITPTKQADRSKNESKTGTSTAISAGRNTGPSGTTIDRRGDSVGRGDGQYTVSPGATTGSRGGGFFGGFFADDDDE